MIKNDPVFTEAMRLHALGFGVHWAEIGSKKPLGFNWQRPPRHDEQWLKENYTPGMNLGVVLGESSKIGDLFLHVIDCDFKIPKEDPRHDLEMAKFLAEIGKLTEKEDQMPRVNSGRQNGSHHKYIFAKEPLNSHKIFTSPEIVKSKYIKDGVEKEKKGPAWFIELLASRTFCVLPPSVHPDSGKKYEWESPLASIAQIPLITDELFESLKTARQTQGRKDRAYTLTDIDLEKDERMSQSPSAFELIANGDWTTSGMRSEKFFELCKELFDLGFTEDEIASISTDRKYNLHEYPKSVKGGRATREREAIWAGYTIEKALKSFMSKPAPQEAPEKVFEKEAQDINAPHLVWQDGLTYSKRSREIEHHKLQNVILLLKNLGGEGNNPLAYDGFSNEIILISDAPYGKKGEKFSDAMAVQITHWLSSSRFKLQPSKDILFMAVEVCAKEQAFHPVRDYLTALEWDKKPRLETWLKDYLNAQGPGEYLSAVGLKTLVAMVKRAFEPGCKFDQMLMLEGEQGSGKSSTVSILGGEWAYTGYIDPSDKDTVMNFLGAWVIEIAELSGMNRGDQNHIKGFVTTAIDKIRPPYGRVSIPIPRQCIFIGTTNDDRYLRDESGNRRYWPVKVGATKFTELARDRDQLFAEAKMLYDLGEEVFISDKKLQLTERAEQMRRLVPLDYEDAMILWAANKLENPDRDPIDIKSFTIKELFDYPLSFDCYNKQNAWHVGKLLERMNFFKIQGRKNDERFRGWSITDDALTKISK